MAKLRFGYFIAPFHRAGTNPTLALQRDLERVFGVSFTTLRTRIRLRAAAAYLHDRSVTETAHLVGYASASAFVTAFTREYGQTPGEFSGGGGASGARTRDQRIMSPRL